MSRVEPNRNVYVGHRYVPKIFGEWDKQNQYEGLSIVTHQGNSYTSKKRVPVGIDILNEEFWVVTGNYNAQVEEYRKETERVSQKLDEKASHEDFTNFKNQTDTTINTFKTDVNKNISDFKSETGETITDFKKDVNQNISDFKSETEQGFEEINEEILKRSLNVTDFGAVGDGLTDDTKAFKDFANYCKQFQHVFYAPENLKYLITDNVDLFGIKHVVLKGEILSENENDVFEIGYNSQSTEKTSYDVGHVQGMILRVSGIKNAMVKIQYAQFLELYADSTNTLKGSMSYSSFYLGMIRNMKITSPNLGWINELKFFGGRITNLTFEGEYAHNHNHFYNPNFENAVINMDTGTFNYFHNFRGEFGIEVNLSERTHSNVFIRTWHSASTQFLRGRGKIIEWNDLGKENHNLGFSDMFYNKENFFTLSPNSNNIDYDIFKKKTRSSQREWLARTGHAQTPIFESRVMPLDQPFRIRLYSDVRALSFRLYAYDKDQNPIKEQNGLFTSIISGSFNADEGYYYRVGSESDISLALINNTGVEFFKIVILTDYSEKNQFHYVKGDIYSPSYNPTPLIEGLPQYTYNRASAPPENNDGRYFAGEVIRSKNANETGCLGWVNKIDANGGSWEVYGNKKNHGIFIADGTGKRVQWTIPHGLGLEPSKFGAVAKNRATGESNILYADPNSANLIVFTETPVPEGTENVQINWFVEK